MVKEKENILTHMGMRLTTILLLMLQVVVGPVLAQVQSVQQLIAKGNSSYEQGDFATAQQWYEQALRHEESNHFPEVQLNLGNTFYQQKKYKEALMQYNQLAMADVSPVIKSAAFYNSGNTMLTEKDYAAAIEAYKQCLRLNPHDADARYNFTLATARLHSQNGSGNTAPQKREKEFRPPPQQSLSPEALRKLQEKLHAAENETQQSRADRLPAKKTKEKDW